MEESKKYADMSYIDFIKNVLEIKLTKEQETIITLFEEVKTKKVEYINNPVYPLWGDGRRDTGERPWISPTITYSSGDSTNIDNLTYNKNLNELATAIRKERIKKKVNKNDDNLK